MKKFNKAFVIALVVAIVSVISISAAMAHNSAGNCTHKHYITNLDGSDNHTSGSTLRSPSFDGITSCTAHDGSAGTCKNVIPPGEAQHRAKCVKNSTSYSNRFPTWNLGRKSIRIQPPRYEYSLRSQTPKSENSESTPKFRTYRIR